MTWLVPAAHVTDGYLVVLPSLSFKSDIAT